MKLFRRTIHEFIWYEDPEIVKDNPGCVEEENARHIREITEQLESEGYAICDTNCVSSGTIKLKTRYDKPPETVETFKIIFYGYKHKAKVESAG